MAQIRLPDGAEIRGSIGGRVYSRNRYGNYIRGRTKPVNPSSPAQVLARNRFSEASIAWRSLTDAQRAAWSLYGLNTPTLNRLGESILLSGNLWFVQAATMLLQAGVPIVDDGPTSFGLADPPTGITATADIVNQEIDVAFDDAAEWAVTDGAFLFVEQYIPRPISWNFIPSGRRLIGVVAGDALTPPTSPQAIDVAFPIAAGMTLKIQVTALLPDGRRSSRTSFQFQT